MGIPVSGKNLFPSNIAGLPTWYTIRANKHGYIGRKKEIDLVVALNPETAKEDALTLEAGAAVVYDEPMKLNALRTDLTFYPVPFDKIVAAVCPDARLRRLVRNMIYDGVLAHLLGIDMAEMEKALNRQLGKKQKALALNKAALQAGFDFAQANFAAHEHLHVERMNETAGKILIEGNAAAAIGCLMAGVTVVAWYPITPSSSLCESLIDYMRKYRIDKETGKATFAIVQAEDEIAAIGMVIGASWVGARAMTSTSGPGVSLMGEFTGLGYYAEVPAVIFDIQRVGPSTGLPTRTAQGDILTTAVLSHGDTRHPLLLPHSVGECYTMSMAAFDLAERLQSPVFVMSDLDLGHEHVDVGPVPVSRDAHRSGQGPGPGGDRAHRRVGPLQGRGRRRHPVPLAARHRRAAVLRARLGPQRPRPGTASAPTITCRTWIVSSASSIRRRPRAPARDRSRAMARVSASSPTARATGRCSRAATSCATRRASRRRTCACGLPVPRGVAEFIAAHDRVYVVEQNRDAQMLSLLRMDSPGGDQREAAQRAALQRAADRRAEHHRYDPGAGRRVGRRRARDAVRAAACSPQQ